MKNAVRMVGGALLMAALLATAGMAHAIPFAVSDSIAFQDTNFNSSLTVARFNPGGNVPGNAVLDSIVFTLTGHIQADIKLESLDAAASTVTAHVNGSITLQRPNLSTIVVTLPTISTTDNFTAFDGVIDFGGTSGNSHLAQTASSVDSHTSPPPLSDLADFTGAGSVIMPVSAVANVSATGAGNLITQFHTQAAADVQVVYNYHLNQVPEPATLSLMGLGLLGLAGAVRARRRS